jgi:hypothetical protein
MRDFQGEYLELLQKRDDLNIEIQRFLDDYAAENCPFHVGDKIKIYGYSHFGKDGMVNGVKGINGFYNHGPGWKVVGRVYRKDGTPGNRYFDFRDDQYGEKP